MKAGSTYWASEPERDEWFRHAVTSGLIDWPSLGFKRPFTFVSDEQGRELPAPAHIAGGTSSG
jgi:hypothetical protein